MNIFHLHRTNHSRNRWFRLCLRICVIALNCFQVIQTSIIINKMNARRWCCFISIRIQMFDNVNLYGATDSAASYQDYVNGDYFWNGRGVTYIRARYCHIKLFLNCESFYIEINSNRQSKKLAWWFWDSILQSMKPV